MTEGGSGTLRKNNSLGVESDGTCFTETAGFGGRKKEKLPGSGMRNERDPYSASASWLASRNVRKEHCPREIVRFS